MADNEKLYQVLPGKRYTGKHRVYKGEGIDNRKKGDVFPSSELFGNRDNQNIALNGQKAKKREDGRTLPERKPVIKVYNPKAAAKAAEKSEAK